MNEAMASRRCGPSPTASPEWAARRPLRRAFPSSPATPRPYQTPVFDTLLILLTAVLVVLTLLPLARSQQWWIRIWDFPRLQLACVAAVLAIAALALARTAPSWGWALAGLCSLCLLSHLAAIVGFTPLASKESLDADLSDDPPQLSLLMSNVQMSNRQAERLLALVRTHRPDVFVTLESNAWWESQLDTLAGDYPHSVKCPLENRYGMHVYSRLPINGAAIRYLVEADIPSIHGQLRLPGAEPIEVHFVHPTPPSPTENDRSTERDAELVLVGRSVAASPGPAIVCGDLNDVAWSRTTRLFRKISGLLDPRRGRGLCNTFHARWFFLRWPLDHLFHSRHFTLIEMRRLDRIGSDHFPVLVRIACEPEKYARQSGPRADAEDQAEASKKLRAASRSG
jgi:endonuclease/exonuclease/phosphatase (EEP) superfamily protein YafD